MASERVRRASIQRQLKSIIEKMGKMMIDISERQKQEKKVRAQLARERRRRERADQFRGTRLRSIVRDREARK